MSNLRGSTISAILRHDSMVTSYKIALQRATYDVVLAFPDLSSAEQAVAIPLRMLADRWIAYYWPLSIRRQPFSRGQSRSATDRPVRICRFALSSRASMLPGRSSSGVMHSPLMAPCWWPTCA